MHLAHFLGPMNGTVRRLKCEALASFGHHCQSKSYPKTIYWHFDYPPIITSIINMLILVGEILLQHNTMLSEPTFSSPELVFPNCLHTCRILYLCAVNNFRRAQRGKWSAQIEFPLWLPCPSLFDSHHFSWSKRKRIDGGVS